MKSFSDKRLLTVFGGSGFLGRYLLRHLARKGYMVRVVTRNPRQAGFVRVYGEVGQIAPVYGSVTDVRSIERNVQGAQGVINLVGILKEPLLARGAFQRVHHEGARRIAECAAQAGAQRLIHVSALGVHKVKASRYARSKIQGEEAVRKAFPTATIVRPGLVFGYEDRFFPLFASLARFTPVLPVFRTHMLWGLNRRGTRLHPVYVGDVAQALAKLVETPAMQGQDIDIVGPQAYPFGALMQLIAQTIGRKRLLLPLPLWLVRPLSYITNVLPGRLLTPDNVRLLAQDNIAEDEDGLKRLGIRPQALEDHLPSILQRFQKK